MFEKIPEKIRQVQANFASRKRPRPADDGNDDEQNGQLPFSLLYSFFLILHRCCGNNAFVRTVNLTSHQDIPPLTCIKSPLVIQNADMLIRARCQKATVTCGAIIELSGPLYSRCAQRSLGSERHDVRSRRQRLRLLPPRIDCTVHEHPDQHQPRASTVTVTVAAYFFT